MQFLLALGVWLVGSAAARVLLGAGLAVGFHAWVSGYVDDLLTLLVSSVGGIAGGAGQLILLAGAGEALSIIGGAMVARAAIISAQAFVARATG